MRLKSSRTNESPIPNMMITRDDAKIMVEILSILKGFNRFLSFYESGHDS